MFIVLIHRVIAVIDVVVMANVIINVFIFTHYNRITYIWIIYKIISSLLSLFLPYCSILASINNINNNLLLFMLLLFFL